MTTQSLTRSTEYHYWPSDIWSNQWNKNGREILFLLTQPTLISFIFCIRGFCFDAVNLRNISSSICSNKLLGPLETGDKIFSPDIYLYSICIGSGRVRSHGVRSKPLVWDAGVARFTVRWETHVSMPGCQGDGRCWHCRGRATTESSARLSSAAVTALWSSQGVEQRWRWNHSEDLTSAGHNNYQQLNIFTWRKLNNFIREYSAPQHQICSLSLLCASTAQGKFHLEVSACAVRSYRPVLPWCSLSLSLSLSFLLPAVLGCAFLSTGTKPSLGTRRGDSE